MGFPHVNRVWRDCVCAALLISCGALFSAGAAWAGLGERRASIDLDRQQMAARLTSTDEGSYTVHDLALSNGTVAREYTRADGVVFAVSWQGPVRPDLKQLFGGYFPRFQADNVQSGRIRMRRALSSNHLDFVVQTGGHSGASWGYAVLPLMTPSGFTYEVLQ